MKQELSNDDKARVKAKKPHCYNCIHASPPFKIADKTHHQCNHPKHNEGFKNDKLSPWDTLQEWYNTCDTHEFKTQSESSIAIPKNK